LRLASLRRVVKSDPPWNWFARSWPRTVDWTAAPVFCLGRYAWPLRQIFSVCGLIGDYVAIKAVEKIKGADTFLSMPVES